MENNESIIMTKIGLYNPILIRDFIKDNTHKSVHVNICKSIFNLKENENVTIIISNEEDSDIDNKYMFIKCKVISLETKTEFCTTDKVIKRYVTGNVILKIKEENLFNIKNHEGNIILPIEYISIDNLIKQRENVVDLLLNSNNNDLKDYLVKVIKTQKDLRNLSIGDELLIDSEEMFNTYVYKNKKHLLSDINYKNLKIVFKIDNFIIQKNGEIKLKGGVLLDKCDKLFLDYLYLFDIRDTKDHINSDNIIDCEFYMNSPILVMNRIIEIKPLTTPNEKIYVGDYEELCSELRDLLYTYSLNISNLKIPEITDSGVSLKEFKAHNVTFSTNHVTHEVIISIKDKTYDKPISLDFISIKPNKENIELIGLFYEVVVSNINGFVMESLRWYKEEYIDKNKS